MHFDSIFCQDALKVSSYPFLYGGLEDKVQMFGISDSVEIKTPRGKKKRKRRKKNEDQLEGSIKALDRYKDHVQRNSKCLRQHHCWSG